MTSRVSARARPEAVRAYVTGLRQCLQAHQLEEPFTDAFQGFRNCTDADGTLKRAERARNLSLASAADLEGKAIRHNRQGLRQIARARERLTRIRSQWPRIEKARGKISKDRLEEVVDELGQEIQELVTDAESMSGEDAAVVWQAFTKARQRVIESGEEGLLDFIGSAMDDYVESRRDLKRAKAIGNPTPINVIAAAAIFAGVTITLMIDCYTKHGCATFMDAIIAGACLAGMALTMGISVSLCDAADMAPPGVPVHPA